MTDERVKKAPIRWHGSKWRIAPWVMEHFPEHFTYVEPFCGSAAVLLQKHRSKAEVLNDQDKALINFFQVAREQPEELVRSVGLTPFSRHEYIRCWELMRDDQAVPLERARAFVVSTVQARGSIVGRTSPTGWRIWAKSSNFGSTPADQWLNVPDRIEAMINRLRGVYLECRDARQVIWDQDSKKTLFYCDPPYVDTTRTGGTMNYAHEYSLDDHAKLANALHRIKGYAVISGYDSPHYDDMYRGWSKYKIQARAEMNKDRIECLWLNPSANEALMASRSQMSILMDGT